MELSHLSISYFLNPSNLINRVVTKDTFQSNCWDFTATFLQKNGCCHAIQPQMLLLEVKQGKLNFSGKVVYVSLFWNTVVAVLILHLVRHSWTAYDKRFHFSYPVIVNGHRPAPPQMVHPVLKYGLLKRHWFPVWFGL